MHSAYVVLAHLPFKGDPDSAEWVIFTGVHGKAQAEGKAKNFRSIFREVQIREVSQEIL